MTDKHFVFVVHKDSPLGIFMLPDFYEDFDPMLFDKFEETTFDFSILKYNEKLNKHSYKVFKLKEEQNYDQQNNFGTGVEEQNPVGDNQAQ